MQEVGLYLTDLCLHDSSREIVLAGWQHGARLEISYEKVIVSFKPTNIFQNLTFTKSNGANNFKKGGVVLNVFNI